MHSQNSIEIKKQLLIICFSLSEFNKKHEANKIGEVVTLYGYVDLNIATYKKYQITEKKLNEYLKYNGKNDVRLKERKLGFIEDFNTFMKLHYGNFQNTTGKHLKNMKSYLKYATTNDWITKSPFQKFKVTYRAKEKPSLTYEELVQIENIEIEKKVLCSK